MKSKSENSQNGIPTHVAIIMDGNGRWATARGLNRSEGHIAGVKTVRTITEEASKTGVKYLTLYTFSTENWNRPKEEVDALMHLIMIAIERETPDLIANNVRLLTIGDMGRLPEDARLRLESSKQRTAHCTGLNLVLAISYSAKWEMVEAVKQIASDCKEDKLDISRISADTISDYLTTRDMPDPDLLIRTGGETRISNFLLWQIAYTELDFTDVLWPDFSAQDFRNAIERYMKKERRFGFTSDQVSGNQS